MTALKFAIILVDDDLATLQALNRVLKDDFDVHIFTSPTEALQQLEPLQPAIIIADGSMPEMSGISFLQSCKKMSPDSVRILLSGDIRHDDIEKHLANDLIHRFTMKPWENQVLRLQMLEALKLHQSLKSQLNFENLSQIDPLTHLYNKRAFDQKLSAEFSRSKRSHVPFSLLMIDVDHFKSINDTEGHLFGDKVLSDITQMMKSKLRPTDWLFRFGGDEFVAILPGASTTIANEVSERLRSSIERMYQSPDQVSVSIGLSTYPDLCPDPEKLLQHADLALYEAKNRGRNQTIIASQN